MMFESITKNKVKTFFIITFFIIFVMAIVYFISLWLFPIWNIIKYKRNVVRVTAFMLFITVECCTLEPLTLGRIPFWMFFIYIVFISNRCRYEKNDM